MKSEAGTPVPPERETPPEVPHREVEHEEPYDPDADWTTFPGQLPVGTMRLDLFSWTPKREDVERWRREVEEREARRPPFGFRAAGT